MIAMRTPDVSWIMRRDDTNLVGPKDILPRLQNTPIPLGILTPEKGKWAILAFGALQMRDAL